MKRILTKKRFVMLAFLLGMTAFGFGVTGLSAQTADNIQWKAPAEAIAALNQELGTIDVNLQQNPNDDLLTFKRKFYYAISMSIEEGQEVPVALNYGYAMFVPASGPSVFDVELIPNNLGLSTWKAYYQDAVQLLKL